MTAITEESLSVSGVLLAKVFNRQASEVERYSAENARQVDLQVRQAMTGQSFFAVVQTFLGVTPALVYLVAGFLIAAGAGRRHAGTIVAFTTLQTRLLFPTVNLLRVSLDVQTSLALFGRIFEYLDLRPRIVDAPGRAAARPRRRSPGGSSWTTSGSPTPRPRSPGAGAARTDRPPAGGRCRSRRSSSSRASSRRSSGRAARARPRSPTSSRGCTTSTAAGS